MFHSYEEESAFERLRDAIREGDPYATSKAMKSLEESRFPSSGHVEDALTEEEKLGHIDPRNYNKPIDYCKHNKLNGQMVVDVGDLPIEEGNLFLELEEEYNLSGKMDKESMC